MAVKVILFLISLFFLFGGGICSVALADQSDGLRILGIVMALISLWSFIKAIAWLFTKNTADAKSPAALILISAAFVIFVYIICWSGLVHVRFTG